MMDENKTPDEGAEADNAGAGEAAELTAEERLEDKEREVADLRDKLLRQAAETENVRRRLEKEKQDASAYAMTGFARDLLGVADNFRRALSAVSDELRANAALSPLLTGIEMTERELQSVFERHQITRVEAMGEKLDPNRHQAMIEVESEDATPGTVVQVMQEGYMIRDRLLRPALVGVAKAPAAQKPAGSTVDTTA